MIRVPVARRWGALVALIVCTVGALAGCNGAAADPHIAQIQQLEDKLSEQSRLREQRDQQIAEQGRIIQDLRGLDGARRLEQLVHVARVEIERLSGGYDDDRDGVAEGVVVYLRLFDSEGDVIKAAGSAKVNVFDVSTASAPRTVCFGQWTAEQMNPLWFGALMTSHYNLRVPWPAGIRTTPSKTLTLVVQFTELLSGRTFEAQRAVDVTGAAEMANAKAEPPK